MKEPVTYHVLSLNKPFDNQSQVKDYNCEIANYANRTGL